MQVKAPENIEGVDLARWYTKSRKNCELYNCDGDRVPMHTMGQGKDVFLMCSGPSLNDMDLSLLSGRGIVVMGLNNSPSVLAERGLPMPQLWTCVDTPRHFIEQIWKDPAIMKFAPYGHIGTKLKARTPEGKFVDSVFTVDKCPNVWYYKRESKFEVSSFLTKTDFTWGNREKVVDDLGIEGSRSVMLVAVKLLYYLGFKRVNLIGADFHMEVGRQNYAFKQNRTEGSVKNNNKTYENLNRRFEALRPKFHDAGFTVRNCTLNSGLVAFDFFPFEEAVKEASQEVTEKPILTEGHYEL